MADSLLADAINAATAKQGMLDDVRVRSCFSGRIIAPILPHWATRGGTTTEVNNCQPKGLVSEQFYFWPGPEKSA
jgi:hypothetical protein